MGSRVSTRAQVALALGLALLLGTLLQVGIGAAVMRRVLEVESQRDRAAAAQALARSIAAACEGAPPGCAEERAREVSQPELKVAVVGVQAVPERGAGAAPLPGAGTLLVSARPAAGQERAQATTWFAAYALLGALFTFLVGVMLLNRVIALPLDRLAAAAERIGRLELDDPLGGEIPTLGRLGGAFERMARSLKEERARVAAQIAELERLNRQLGEARDSLVRSEKLATVGRLAAGVAHEVGNPLGAILGYLELCRSKAAPEVGELLARIDREVARIDRTVRELLDFSRPGPQAGALGKVALRDAVEAAVRLASVQKRLKGVDFSLDVPVSLSVLAEPHHLSQVLVNVLLNAGDAMKGQGRVEIHAGPAGPAASGRAGDLPGGPRVELSFADSGPGIAAGDLPRVFDPFFTTKEPGEGTGLGLAICHRIMETFGGEIRAGNRAQGGAVFTLCFREAP